MASLQVTEITATSEREANFLFGEEYDTRLNTGTNPLSDVSVTAVVPRACPVGGHVLVTDLAGLRSHMYSKHKITIPPRPKPRAYSWA